MHCTLSCAARLTPFFAPPPPPLEPTSSPSRFSCQHAAHQHLPRPQPQPPALGVGALAHLISLVLPAPIAGSTSTYHRPASGPLGSSGVTPSAPTWCTGSTCPPRWSPPLARWTPMAASRAAVCWMRMGPRSYSTPGSGCAGRQKECKKAGVHARVVFEQGCLARWGSCLSAWQSLAGIKSSFIERGQGRWTLAWP